MLKPLAILQQILQRSTPHPQQFRPYSQGQLINLLFQHRQCPHCHATHTVTVIAGSEAGAFDFDLSCSACATEYEVRPTENWCKYPQQITMYPISDRCHTLQPESSCFNSAESYPLQLEPAFNA